MILKLDYDFMNRRQVLRIFEMSLIRIRRVYESKRMYYPLIGVYTVGKTAKGYHVIVEFIDPELKLTKSNILILQTVFMSDPTRTMFDLLRINRKDKFFNLMFSYKNGKEVSAEDCYEFNRMVTRIFNKKRMQYKATNPIRGYD